uniref:GTP-binding protein n=1 Tax=Globodera pallida TaxID=36090 RepID=A0A183BQ69_GLOPA
MSKRKVLLMGKSGAGKTSMRSIIFANYIARDTSRLGPTMEVEHAHVKFLGNMVLHLWDCGGQETFMENYMTAQRDQIFKNVQVLIYVFDVESREVQKDYRNYQSCLDALMQNSPTAKIFQDKERDINQLSEATALRQHTNPSIQCFRSSIWDETLYNAWSAIVYQLVPNVSSMEHKLKKFADIMDADEILLFEKATFLVIAQAQRAKHEDIHRFEKVSNIIKQFKLSRMGSQFESIEIRNSFTYNTYVMLVLSDGNVSSAAIKMNIQSARKHFEKLDCNVV